METGSAPLWDLDSSVPQRFAAVHGPYRDRIALSDATSKWTYAELADAVDRIAAAVGAAVQDRPGPVAILLSHEIRFPAAMLGVLAAGRGYVPLDADHPLDRNRRIADHAGAAAIVSAGPAATAAAALFGADRPIIDLDRLDRAPARAEPSPPRPDDLAWITYTSGSTGQPKGVFQDHRGLLHDVMQSVEVLGIGPDDRLAMFNSPSLLQGTRISLGALLTGASAHILSPPQLGPAGLAREIRDRQVTIFRSVPAVFGRVADAAGEDREALASLRVVYLGGDRVGWNDYSTFRRVCPPGAKFGTHLGSTECSTVYLHWFVDGSLRKTSPQLPVGRAVVDRHARLLDECGNPVAIGEVGEFVVSSRYLARGYWNDPELTARVFGTDPNDPAVRIYRTGDLGRQREDGLFEFAGRRDSQVKIRGYRLETGEVEGALRGCAGIRDAAVVVRRNPAGVARALAAYVEVGPDGAGLQPRHVKVMASRVLPPFMMPAAISVLPELPRMMNLKIDRPRLAEIDAGQRAAGAGRVAESIPGRLARVFEDVLEVTGAADGDNLASLGGDSLQAVAVRLEIERRFGLSLPADVFEASRSIRDLAEWIEWRKTLPATPPPSELADVGDLAAEIASALTEKRSPCGDAFDRSPWADALDRLLEEGNVAAAAHGARYLLATDAGDVYARNVVELFARLPPDDDATPFVDDTSSEMQVVARPGTDRVIFCFCGRGRRLGLPLAVVHRWLGRLPASIVYLRDLSHLGFLNGIPSIAPEREPTLAALRSLAASLGARQVACYGNSSGGFAALHYGLDLDAEAVVCASAVTDLALAQKMAVNPAVAAGRSERIDLRDLLARAKNPPPTLLVYGAGNWDDRLQAEGLAGAPGVTLDPFPGYDGHHVAAAMIRAGQFSRVLDWLMQPAGTA